MRPFKKLVTTVYLFSTILKLNILKFYNLRAKVNINSSSIDSKSPDKDTRINAHYEHVHKCIVFKKLF